MKNYTDLKLQLHYFKLLRYSIVCPVLILNKNFILDTSTSLSFIQGIENICFVINIKKNF
jgi:hypothetical protein